MKYLDPNFGAVPEVTQEGMMVPHLDITPELNTLASLHEFQLVMELF